MSTVANAWIDDYGRAVRFIVGNRYPYGGGEVFQTYGWGADNHLRLGEPQALIEGVAARPDESYSLPFDAAEALYKALDRIFGGRDTTAPVVKETLAKERERVDKMMDVLIEIARP